MQTKLVATNNTKTRGGAGRGQGRRALPEHARRRHAVAVRFTDDELAALEADADAEGVTVAELARTRALAVEVRSVTRDRTTIASRRVIAGRQHTAA